MNSTENTERENKKKQRNGGPHIRSHNQNKSPQREFKCTGLGKKHPGQKLTQRKLAHQGSYCSKYMIFKKFVRIHFTLIKNTFTFGKIYKQHR